LLSGVNEAGYLVGAPNVVFADAATGGPLVVGKQRKRRNRDDSAPDRQLEDGAEWREIAPDARCC
jgi:hypothetical protein